MILIYRPSNQAMKYNFPPMIMVGSEGKDMAVKPLFCLLLVVLSMVEVTLAADDAMTLYCLEACDDGEWDRKGYYSGLDCAVACVNGVSGEYSQN